MYQYKSKPIISYIEQRFSELPPSVWAGVLGVGFFGLMVFCGFSAGFVLSIFVLFFTQSGPFFAGAYILCIAFFSIFGLVKGFQLYKQVMLSSIDSDSVDVQ